VLDALRDTITTIGFKDIIEIAIIAALVFAMLNVLWGSRGGGLVRGLVILVAGAFLVAMLLVWQFQLRQLALVLDYLLTIAVLAMVIIFQPELRRALILLGRNPLLRFFVRRGDPVSHQIALAAQAMANRRIGALVAFQRRLSLNAYIDNGSAIDSVVSADVLNMVFWPGSPLHDGAVIVREGRIAAAACQLPLAELPADSAPLGMRHRAAMGMSEETDALVLVVSEETGTISLALDGRLRRVEPGRLQEIIARLTTEKRPVADETPTPQEST